MGNSCQSCISDRHTVTSPPHGREGSSPDQHFPTDLPIPTTSSPPLSHHEGSSLPPQPPINSLPSSPLSIDSLNLRFQKVDPVDQIEPLISFVDYHLHSIKGSSQEASSSSSSHLTSVASNTTLAAQFIDFISTEAEKLQKTDIAKEMGGLALEGLKKVGEAHWVFLGLSVVASALERCITVRSNVSECIDLLQAIVFLAKDLKVFRERMPHERQRLCEAVQMIVEGAIMCSDYISKGRLSRYWLAATTQDQLGKTNESIRYIRTSLSFVVNLDIHKNTTELVRTITKRLPESPFRLIEFEAVGIEAKVEEVKALLEIEGTEPARAVVLCGFGGVGKSTLAASVIKNLYQNHPHIRADYKFCRVIIDDKSADVTSHIKQLQRDIIYDFGGGKQDLRNPQEGHQRLQDVMENKSCLLFIDNVVDKKYVQQLLPEDLLWFNKSNNVSVENVNESKNMSVENLDKSKTKLRILITSREKNLTSKLNITCEEYDVKVFSDKVAKSFLTKTILQADPHFRGGFDENACINDVADACRGVPILLSVFGKHLRDDRNLSSYREALKALREGNPDGFAKEENLSNQLFFVYSKLMEEEREAFLDICIFFHGWDWELVCKILDDGTVRTLQSKMLINKSDSGVVLVHDVLRLMGEKQGERTRISNCKKLLEVIEDGDEADIKGISLVGNESLITVESRHLNATWKSLRVLMVGDWVKINGPRCNRAFKKLRYLSVGDTIDFPFEDVSKLVGLTAFFNGSKEGMNLHKLPPSLKIISHHVPDRYVHSFETLPLQNLPSLQKITVEAKKLVKLPEGIGLPASLVNLQLNCCGQLPKQISNLAALERLTLDKCDLECLPQGMGKLKKLKYLSMQSCTKLGSLPEELGVLSSITCLRLSGCALLQHLPEDLGNLSALEQLSLRDCDNLRELPQRIGSLSSLQKLDLTRCTSLKTLPESFAELRIESLTLHSVLNLESLPSSFGNMPFLSHLELISCNSLSTLPNSFVLFKCLKTLEIRECGNIVALPEDFGKLSLLSTMTLSNCPKLQELPPGFQALPALKIFHLIRCYSIASLPSGFGELTCLETLRLISLSISSLPDGFRNLKRLVSLTIFCCYKLETLSDDFETLPSLSILDLWSCYKLDGATMEKIIKLQHCFYVDIGSNAKLIERWGEIREEVESPMVVCTGEGVVDKKEWSRAARAGLLRGKCVEWDSIAQELIERSTSMLFEENTTVAVIALPLRMEFHHHHLLQRLVGAAMEKAKTDSTSGRLRIFYVKRVKEKGETTKLEKEEEECFGQILKFAPIGSCAIASTDVRCHRLLTYLFFDYGGYRADNKLACCMANVVVHDKQHKFGDFKHTFGEDDISGEAAMFQSSDSSYKEEIISNRIGEFIESICSGKSSETAGPPNESRLTDFIRILKENNAQHLVDGRLNEVPLDQLKGNVVGIFMSDLNTPEYIKLEQIYKELKCEGHNFEMIWIPLLKNELYGLGTYTRAIQKMSWTVLPNPNMVKVERKNPVCIVFDEEGNIANQNALSAMMSWGVEAFPFTKSKVNEIVSIMHIESSLSFLFNKSNLVNRGIINDKLIFLYAEPPSSKLKMKFSLEQSKQIHRNVQIIYVGYLFEEDCDIAMLKDVYEDTVQEMHWPKLSFEDMVTFWYRCKYYCEEIDGNLNLINEELKLLGELLYIEKRWLVALDSDGAVTRSGYEMVKMMCKINNEKMDEVDVIMRKELLESLSLGKCNQMVRKYFRDTIINHPKHPQHDLVNKKGQYISYICDSCYFSRRTTWDQKRRYRCDQCNWDLCSHCWELFVKGEVQNCHQ